MWVSTLNAIALLVIVAALGFVLFFMRKLDGALTSLVNEQGERLRKIERDLDRVRQALDSVSTGVMAIDIRQRIKKG